MELMHKHSYKYRPMELMQVFTSYKLVNNIKTIT